MNTDRPQVYPLSMANPVKREWVNCPICGEPDMRREEDGNENVIISCVNHACASNGGNNANVLLSKYGITQY